MTSEHVATDRLIDLVNGVVPPSETARITSHCASCERCGDELAIFVLLKRQHERSRGRRARLVAAAAVLALALGLAAIAAEFVKGGGESVIAAFDPEEGIAALATTDPPPRAFRRFRFGITRPADGGSYLDDLQAGVAAIIDGNYQDAIDDLSHLYATSPNGEVAAYLGIARYLAGERDPLVERLLRLGVLHEGHDMVSRYSLWYLGNFYLSAGRLVEAREVLDRLAQGADGPGRDGAALLQRMRELEASAR